MKKIQQLLAALVVISSAAILVVTASVSAATSSGNGMRVSPVRTDLVMQPGDSKTISIYVQNVTNGTENLKVLANDFVASDDESGAPALLLNGESNDKHGLKKYISAPSTLTIESGKQKEIKVTVSIPKGLPGGGYYGAIRFAPASSSAADNTNVSLQGSVGSLILVRVPGDVTEKVTLVSFDARALDPKTQKDSARTVFTTSKNILATVRLRNEGNIQEQPFGKVILKKGSTVLGTYELNGGDQPANVLPDSIRKFNIKLKDVGSFGKYTLEGNFGYGTAGELLSAKTTFYVIPIYMIILGLAIVGLILFLIFGLPRMVRAYNKSVLRKAGRR
jgi:hypothetical protein